MFCDGNGLYLRIEKTGSKRWVFRYMLNKKRRDMGLGSAELFSLSQARSMALDFRRQVKLGIDPINQRREDNRQSLTFSQAAHLDYEKRKDGWKNPKHASQWITTLEHYAFPRLGKLQIRDIKTTDIVATLSPIWLSKSETARRVKQRISAVFDWAKANGYLETENPANGVLQGLPKQTAAKKHHAAMPWRDLPTFFAELAETDGLVQSVEALKFTILTVARSIETRFAHWDEIDLESAVWTIPADKMKAKREHRVPLSAPALAILQAQHPLTHNSGWVFSGAGIGKPLSNMAMANALNQRRTGFTVHGFRSTFRDWSAEETDFPNEVCEQALAHTIGNSAEAAYRRTSQFEKRRRLMQLWGEFAGRITATTLNMGNSFDDQRRYQGSYR